MLPRRIAYFLLSILAACALTIAMVSLVMRPPLNDLKQLALFFTATGSASAVIGFVSHRLGWWRRMRSLNQTLTLGYLLAAGITLFNVWITARLMFINAHDLTLAGLLLLFAGGISVSFGYFLSSSITQAIHDLVRRVDRIGEGDFETRLVVQGKDEIARLAEAVNMMTAKLAETDAKSRSLDAARRDLVAWASHDLRTPLSSLRAMLDALADGVVADDETVGRYLRQCQSEVARMSTLLDDLFVLAQLDASTTLLNREPASLADLISDTLEAFRARATARHITITGSIDPGIDPFPFAPDKISRVLQNLIENAIRHTPAGGRIQISATPADGAVLVTVADSGEGISDTDLPHIFDRFYRSEKSRARNPDAERDGTGAGLGLAIAKGFVEAHGGQIWAASDAAGGATFRFRLPTKIRQLLAEVDR